MFPDIWTGIEINVRVVIGRYKKFQIFLIDRGFGLVDGLYRTEHSPLNRPVREDVLLASHKRYLRRGRYDTDSGCLRVTEVN